jgi:hypothetical protein
LMKSSTYTKRRKTEISIPFIRIRISKNLAYHFSFVDIG